MVDKIANRFSRCACVHRREHKMPALSQLHRRAHRFPISELAQHDHIRIHAQRIPRACSKRRHFSRHIALMDQRLLFSKTYSTGDSYVRIWQARVRLICSIIAAALSICRCQKRL